MEIVLGFERRALVGTEAVGEEGERALGDDLRVELLERAGGGVAGLAKVGRPASSRSAFMAAKASLGMKISPRTSSRCWDCGL